MALEKFSIEIIDTVTNTRTLEDEVTSMNAPHLIYNGGDTKYTALLTSELDFNFEVADGASGRYFHLFTGNETRYKAVLSDITDELNPVQIWQGFLLPEQYSEPYTSNVFYVNFKFTDGIGSLKNKYLPVDFYSEQKTIPEIIAACLLLTGNDLPIEIAPAIINAAEPLKLSDLELNTAAYIDDKDKKEDAYFILNEIIISLGCTLLQYFGKWYIIGINRFKDITIITESYTSAGVYSAAGAIVRPVKPAYFEEAPTITLLPPLKKVIIDWNKDHEDNVFPLDLVYQPFVSTSVWQLEMPVKYWVKHGGISITLTSYNQILNLIFEIGSGYVEYFTFKALPTEEPFFLTIGETTTTPETDYIDINNAYYVEADGLDKYVTLDIVFTSFFLTDITSYFNAGDYLTDIFTYELLLNDVVLVSNKSSFTDYEGYDFKFSLDETFKIVGTLKLKRIPILESGYLNIKLFQPKTPASAPTPLKTVFKEVAVEYFTDVDGITKTRGVEYSTVEEIEVNHSDDFTDISKKAILISDDYVYTGVTVDTPESSTLLNTSNYSEFERGSLGYTDTIHRFEIDLADYELIEANPQSLFKQESGSSLFIHLFFYRIAAEGGLYYVETFENFAPVFIATDTLYINIEASSITYDDKRYLRERWARYEKPTEEIRFIDALARIRHDAVSEPRIKIDGNIFGIKLPFDLLTFNYITDNNYQITNLNIDLTEGVSAATIIEQTHEEVTDYIIE